MIRDKYLSAYIGAVKSAIEARRDQLVDSIHRDLYSVGLVQGQVQGLEEALELLEKSMNEADN